MRHLPAAIVAGCGLVTPQPDLVGHQRSQLLCDVLVADLGQGAQPVQVPALAQQPGQFPGGVPAAGVAQDAQSLFSIAAAMSGGTARESSQEPGNCSSPVGST
jgi:hypothetical protein